MAWKMAWTDKQMIEALEMWDVQKLSASEIAQRMSGTSRSAVLGMLHRVRTDLAVSEAAPFPAGQRPAQKRENQDGGMPARWWRNRKAWA